MCVDLGGILVQTGGIILHVCCMMSSVLLRLHLFLLYFTFRVKKTS